MYFQLNNFKRYGDLCIGIYWDVLLLIISCCVKLEISCKVSKEGQS